MHISGTEPSSVILCQNKKFNIFKSRKEVTLFEVYVFSTAIATTPSSLAKVPIRLPPQRLNEKREADRNLG